MLFAAGDLRAADSPRPLPHAAQSGDNALPDRSVSIPDSVASRPLLGRIGTLFSNSRVLEHCFAPLRQLAGIHAAYHAATAVAYFEAMGTGEKVKELAGAYEESIRSLGVPPMEMLEEVAPVAKIAVRVVDPNPTVPTNVLYVRFSKSFLETYFCKEFKKTLPVNDNLLGARVRGTSNTIARTELRLLDNPKRADALLVFKGNAHFRTTATSGPIAVNTQGTSRFTSQKRIWFDGVNLRQSAPATQVDTNSRTIGISTSLPGIRGRISQRIAGRRLAESKALARQITNDRTKAKIENAFDQVVRDRTAAFMESLREQYGKLPFEGQFAIRDIQCTTTPDSLQIVVLGKGEQQPSLAEAPRPLDGNPDIEVHIHTTFVQKAIVDADFRKALQSAVRNIVDRPLVTMINATARPQQGKQQADQPAREFRFHWFEGEELDWLSMAWHAKEPEQPKPPVEAPSHQQTRRIKPEKARIAELPHPAR